MATKVFSIFKEHQKAMLIFVWYACFWVAWLLNVIHLVNYQNQPYWHAITRTCSTLIYRHNDGKMFSVHTTQLQLFKCINFREFHDYWLKHSFFTWNIKQSKQLYCVNSNLPILFTTQNSSFTDNQWTQCFCSSVNWVNRVPSATKFFSIVYKHQKSNVDFHAWDVTVKSVF